MATPTLVKDGLAVERHPQLLTSGGSASINTNEFFFYSNNPEDIYKKDLADNKCFLNRVYGIKGYGQVYCWHRNMTGENINHCLLLHNPNNYPVKVTVPNYGLTYNRNIIPDTTAWAQYCKGYSYPSITIPANGYGNLFMRTSVPKEYVIGIVARLNITKENGAAIDTGLTLFDLAYQKDSGGASGFAPAEDYATTLRLRGLGNGFYTTINAPTLTPTDVANGVGFTIGAASDTFRGMDCSYINADGNLPSGRLPGAYGQQFNVTVPVRNNATTLKTFRIYIGSLGGASCPFIYFNNETFSHGVIDGDPDEPKFLFRDMLQVAIPAGTTQNINFTTVIPASTSAPYAICARRMN